MLESGVHPDTFSFVGILSGCASIGALALGRRTHAHVVKTRTELTPFLGTSLVDMHGKCRCMDDTVAVFDAMPGGCRSLQTWNSMLHGLAVHGLGADAMRSFRQMELDGLQPNKVTFIAVLCGCVHAGLVQEGKFYFDMMRRKYGIEPTVKHYGCMVDLLGRVGLLDEAFKLVSDIPGAPSYVAWGALLSACRTYGNVGMAKMVMQRIAEEEQPFDDTSHYVIMSNVYRTAGLWGKMARVRTKVRRKPRDQSWIEVGGHVPDFSVSIDAFLHPSWSEIKAMLDELKVKVGEESGEEPENPHSEKVAVAFGLISTSAPTPGRVYKNLRICENCHSLLKSISEVYKREILVRYCKRFHRFIGWLCSCREC